MKLGLNEASARPGMRRTLFRIFAVFLLCVLGVAAKPPNVVIVFADDMGYGDPRIYNPRSRVPTPHIDALAEVGMRFTDAHTAASVCTPSRYGLLTGRYPWRSRLPQGIVQSWGQPMIEEGRQTLGSALQALGYRTACIGKWHLGWDWPVGNGQYVSDELDGINPPAGRQEELGRRINFARPVRGGPTTRGFHHYFGDDVPNFPPYAFIENDRVLGNPTDRMPRHKGQRAGPMMPGWDLWMAQPTITAHALEWLDERARDPDTPFFLYMPLLGPHTPIVPSGEHRGTSEAGPYGDWVHQMDAALGKVVQSLERNGLLRDTVVVFSSDNGSPARSGLGMMDQIGTVTELYSHVPNAPWRGLKSDAWEAGHRVPLIVRWDSKVRAGTVSDAAVCLTDLFATIAEITGWEMEDDAGEDSFSLLPLLIPEEGRRFGRRRIVHISGGGMLAIREGPWKLILGSGSGGFSHPRGEKAAFDGDGPMQLYNLAADPSERVNVIGERPSKAQQLLNQLRNLRQAGRSR